METTNTYSNRRITKHNTELRWKPPPSTTPSWSGNHQQAQHRAGVENYPAQHPAMMETTTMYLNRRITKHNTELRWKPPPSTTPNWSGNHHQAQQRDGVENYPAQ